MSAESNAALAASIKQNAQLLAPSLPFVGSASELGELPKLVAYSLAAKIDLSKIEFPLLPVRPEGYDLKKKELQDIIDWQTDIKEELSDKIIAIKANEAAYSALIAPFAQKKIASLKELPAHLLTLEAQRVKFETEFSERVQQIQALDEQAKNIADYLQDIDKAFTGYMSEYGKQIDDYFTIADAANTIFYNGENYLNVLTNVYFSRTSATIKAMTAAQIEQQAVNDLYGMFVSNIASIKKEIGADSELSFSINEWMKQSETSIKNEMSILFSYCHQNAKMQENIRLDKEIDLVKESKLSGIADLFAQQQAQAKRRIIDSFSGNSVLAGMMGIYQGTYLKIMELVKGAVLADNIFHINNIPESAYSNLLQLEYLRQNNRQTFVDVMKSTGLVPATYTVAMLGADEMKISRGGVGDFWSDLRDDVVDAVENVGRKIGRVFLPDSIDNAIHDALDDIKKVLPLLQPGVYIGTYSALGKQDEGFERIRLAAHEFIFSPFEKVFIPESIYKEMKAFEQKYRKEIKIICAIVVAIVAWYSGAIQALGSLLVESAVVGFNYAVASVNLMAVELFVEASAMFTAWTQTLTVGALVDKGLDRAKQEYEDWKEGRETADPELPDLTGGGGSAKSGAMWPLLVAVVVAAAGS